MTTSSPTLTPEVLNRLLIGRELLRSAGFSLTPQSDALAVARAILNAQDAAELVSSALAEHLLADRKDRMGLPEYLESIEKKSGAEFPGKSFFNKLNRARVSFKHHGSLPNVQEFHLVLSKAEDYLDQACSIYLQSSLAELDLSLLIADAEVRSFYIHGRNLCRDRKYREALESLAQAMEAAALAAPMYIGVGESESEVALQLTAYGVDPGAFIRMQQFFPKVGLDNKIEWDIRNYGHSGNWRRPNVEFCLATFLDLVLKLQYATHQPSVVKFSFLFDDVLTPKQDRVLVHSQHYHPLSAALGISQREQQLFAELKMGQRIIGRLIPAVQLDGNEWEKTSFEIADIYVIQYPAIDSHEPIPENTVLIVKAEEVDWSYAEQAGAREHYLHLFEAGGAEKE